MLDLDVGDEAKLLRDYQGHLEDEKAALPKKVG